MNNNYIKLINLTKNNILKLTKQLKFLNYIDNKMLILKLTQCGGGLESQLRKINEEMGNEVVLLRQRLETLDEKLKEYEEYKKKNILEKIQKHKEIEELNRELTLIDQNKQKINEEINKLTKEDYDIFDPNFKNILMERLAVRAFNIKGKEKLIKRRYSFVNFLIRKYYLSTLTVEDSDKYSFLLITRPKEIIEMIEDSQILNHKDLTKFKKAVSKKEITEEQNNQRDFAISETKKMLELQFSDKEYKDLIGVMDKLNSELNEEDKKIIDNFYIVE